MDGNSFFNSLAAWLRATVLVLPFLVGCQGEPKPSAPVEDKPDPNGYKLLKLVVDANGNITANGQPATLEQVAARMPKVKAAGGVIWYYREDSTEQEHPNAFKVVQLGAKHQILIKRSEQPDFSDLEGQAKKPSGK